MAYNPSMCFSPAGIDACAYWRMWLPHLNTPNSRFHFTEGMPPLNDIAECDVMVVQRLMEAGNVQFLNIARTHGIKIVYDLDDNLWSTPKFNPAHNRLKSEQAQRGLLACIEWADHITVSTRELAEVVEYEIGYVRNIATKKPIPITVIDNVVDTKLFALPLFESDPDKIVIGWGGSNTHLGDIEEVWDLLPEIIDKYAHVYFEVIGHPPPKKLIGHPRVRVREWCHISEFAARYATWNWDIVLAPLHKHKFNRSKSSIKMQEAGAIGKPCLAQDIAPYRYFASKIPELKWLLCDGFFWKKRLVELIENKQLRLEMGAAMHKNVEENFNIERTLPLWHSVCSEAFLA